MHLARRAPAAAGNLEGGHRGQYVHQQCRIRLRQTRRCSGDSRCEPSLSCRRANLCRHGALVNRCGRSRRNDVQQRWQCLVPERHGGNVRADERLSHIAMADAAIQLAQRRWSVITGCHRRSPFPSPRSTRGPAGRGIARRHSSISLAARWHLRGGSHRGAFCPCNEGVSCSTAPASCCRLALEVDDTIEIGEKIDICTTARSGRDQRRANRRRSQITRDPQMRMLGEVSFGHACVELGKCHAAKAVGRASSLTCVRCIKRGRDGSSRLRRCRVQRLSQMTRSRCRHSCVHMCGPRWT